MVRKTLVGITLVAVMSLTSGCVVRTYQMTRDRIDQDLSAGNRGFLMGKGVSAEGDRKTTRDTRVVEVELRSPIKFGGKKCPAVGAQSAASGVDMAQPEAGNRGYVTESAPVAVEESLPAVATQEYTVLKGDTLQKISLKLYGTTKKYHKLFLLNQGVLKNPNSLKPGQVIKVFVAQEKPAQENLK